MIARACLGLLALAACARCGPDNPTPLGQWGGINLLIQVGVPVGGPAAVAINVIPADEKKCPALAGDAKAEIGGTRLKVEDRGGKFTNRGGTTVCEGARFEGSLPVGASTEAIIKISDSSATLETRVAAMLADRKLVLPVPALRAQQPASVTVGVASDTATKGTVSFIPTGGSSDAPAFSVMLADGTATAAGPNVTFTVPATAPAGAGTLRFSGVVVPAVAACDGAASCRVSVGVDLSAAATVQP